MTEERIKQNAEEYLKQIPYYGELLSPMTLQTIKEAHIAGAHSRDVEIEELKLENKSLKESLLTRKAEIEDANFLRKKDKELLNNAVSLLRERFEDDDYFCERLLDIPEEEKICEIYCDKEGVLCDCILRYLKHYKKNEN